MRKKILSDQEVACIVQKVFAEFEPILKAHGGGVELVVASATVVTLRLKGHCAGCALAPLTFGLGMEKALKEQIPTLREVRYASWES